MTTKRLSQSRPRPAPPPDEDTRAAAPGRLGFSRPMKKAGDLSGASFFHDGRPLRRTEGLSNSASLPRPATKQKQGDVLVILIMGNPGRSVL